jgi:PRTRC genetic system protein A
MSLFAHYAYTRGMRELPPWNPTKMLEYWMASNGLFVRARRQGFEALIPVAHAHPPVKGLEPLSPALHLDDGRIGPALVLEILADALTARTHADRPKEVLYHLRHGQQGWYYTRPPQEGTEVEVTPTERYDTSSSVPVIDLHSHNSMPPFFSEVDDADEQGCRLGAVLGRIFDHPAIVVRVGLYGHYYPLRADRVFDLPVQVTDGWHDDPQVQSLFRLWEPEGGAS